MSLGEKKYSLEVIIWLSLKTLITNTMNLTHSLVFVFCHQCWFLAFCVSHIIQSLTRSVTLIFSSQGNILLFYCFTQYKALETILLSAQISNFFPGLCTRLIFLICLSTFLVSYHMGIFTSHCMSFFFFFLASVFSFLYTFEVIIIYKYNIF